MIKRKKIISSATVLFAGDSGDGAQTIGAQMTQTSAIVGNDVSTFPDYPAEIRAPAGSLAGVSGFRLHFSSVDIHTPGDRCDVLVAMNPAALRVNLKTLKPNGILIVNSDNFLEKNLKLADYETNPIEDGSLMEKYQLFAVKMTMLTREALRNTGLNTREMDLCKNFFALGFVSWLYNRPLDHTLKWIENKFTKKPKFVGANSLALKAGANYGESTEQSAVTFEIKPAKFPPGKYRNVTGNLSTALGLVAASQISGLPLVYGSYPITPASDILHELAKHKNLGVKTVQMEDEIAAVGVAIGASFAGSLGVTGSSGPGIALKAEAINLAVITEIPLVVVNVQRAGPSTGMPTKTEQSDLLQVLYGRNGESPMPVLAASSPADCFDTVYEACRIATKYMTPVMFLSDGYVANGAEPWLIAKVSDLKPIEVNFRTDQNEFLPYARDEKTLARPWVKPGTPGLEHRIGGLEKEDLTGNVSYDPENHEKMSRLREEKVERIADHLPPIELLGEKSGELLLIGWGGTCGALRTATENKQKEGFAVSHLHLRYLNPLPKELGELMKKFDRVAVAELNLGQLLKVIKARYLVPAIGINKMQGQPFYIHELEEKIDQLLGGKS